MVVVSVTGMEVVGALVDVDDVGLVPLGPTVMEVCSAVVTVTSACGCTAGTVVEGKSSSGIGVWLGGEAPHATISGSDRHTTMAATLRKLRDTWLRVHLN